MVLCPYVVLVQHQGSDVLWHENGRNTAKMEQERGWEVLHNLASFSSQHSLAMTHSLKALGSTRTFIRWSLASIESTQENTMTSLL